MSCRKCKSKNGSLELQPSLDEELLPPASDCSIKSRRVMKWLRGCVASICNCSKSFCFAFCFCFFGSPNGRNSTEVENWKELKVIKTEKKLLLLDMDETLLHSSTEAIVDPDFVFEMQCCQTQVKFKVWVKLRPFLSIFLKFLAEYFDIGIFTAGEKKVGSALLTPAVRRYSH